MAFLLVLGTALFLLWPYLTLETLADHQDALRVAADTRPLLVAGGAFLIYAGAMSVALPGTVVINWSLGWLFGFFPALVISSCASTLGSTLLFLASRYLFRDLVRGWVADWAPGLIERCDREGPFALLSLRLFPIVPPIALNAAMGLTRMPVWTYWWVTQLGMLPLVAMNAYIGSQLPSLRQVEDGGMLNLIRLDLLAILLGLATLPWLVRWGLACFGVSVAYEATGAEPLPESTSAEPVAPVGAALDADR